MNNNSYVQVNKLLLYDPTYNNLSSTAKVLYIFLFDRYTLSVKNDFKDQSNNIYIFFTNAEICRLLHCEHNKATKTLRELEAFGLIARKKQGQGKPDRIYVKDLFECTNNSFNNDENDLSRMTNLSHSESDIWTSNNNKDNNKDDSKTNQSIYPAGNYFAIEESVKNQIEYESLIAQHGKDLIDNIVNTIVGVFCTDEAKINISRNRSVPIELIRWRFLKLDAECIESVIYNFKTQKSIKNPRGYLLSSLYNVIDTNYIEDLV